MDAAGKRAERQRIEEEAASLVVRRFADSEDPATAAAALRWAAQSVTHGVALAQARAAWAAAERLRAVTSQERCAEPQARREQGRSRRSVLAGGLAAAVAVPVAFGVARWLGGERLQTAIGEQRSFALGDGSQVHLNTDSVVDLGVDGDRRVATMIRGEALFDIAAATVQPVTVLAGKAVIDAFRTTFNISLRGGVAELLVARGLVTVVGNGQAHAIAAGGSAAIRRGTVAVARLPPEAVDQRLAWRRGIIDLDGRTLAQAADEFNRYSEHPIIVANPRIASFRLGGNFSTSERDAFVEAVQRSFPVLAVRSEDGSVLLMPSE